MTVAEGSRPILARLAERVRERRTSRAMTLRELAERAGVSQRFLVSLEAGKANISVARLDDLMQLIGSDLPSATALRPHRQAMLDYRSRYGA